MRHVQVPYLDCRLVAVPACRVVPVTKCSKVDIYIYNIYTIYNIYDI